MVQSACRDLWPGEKKSTHDLSASFNWAARGLNDQESWVFAWTLANYGFVLQLVSLVGISTVTIMTELVRRFKDEGMALHIEMVERRENELGVDVSRQQRWSSACYVDGILAAIEAASFSSAS